MRRAPPQHLIKLAGQQFRHIARILRPCQICILHQVRIASDILARAILRDGYPSGI